MNSKNIGRDFTSLYSKPKYNELKPGVWRLQADYIGRSTKDQL